MPTPQKIEIIDNLTQKFQASSGIYFTRYTGMNVGQATELRKQFREKAVSYLISKNTLTRIEATNAGFEDKLNDIIQGQIGIAYSSDDPTAPARVIRNFKKENKDVLEVVGLVFEGEIFSADKYKELAILPSWEVLLAKFASAINQPMSKLASTLSGAMSKLTVVLTNLKENKS